MPFCFVLFCFCSVMQHARINISHFQASLWTFPTFSGLVEQACEKNRSFVMKMSDLSGMC